MLFKLFKVATSAALIALLLSACGGGGGGGGEASNKAVLDISVTGLVAELDVRWAGKTITMTPKRLEAHVKATGKDIGPPESTSPEFQDCSNQETRGTNGRFSLKIVCAPAMSLALVVELENLRDSLTVEWAGETVHYVAGDTGSTLSASPGKLVVPSISARPSLQDCLGTFNRGEGRLFNYTVSCTDHVAINQILVDTPLAYPVTLKAGSDATLTVQQTGGSFESPVSRLEDVVIEEVGGSQVCTLKEGAFSTDPDTQVWALSCEEFLVYSDIRSDSEGVYISYRTEDALLLEKGKVNATEVHTFSRGDRHLVLHPTLGKNTLNFDGDDTDAQWKPDGERTTLDQVLVTNDAVYTLAPSENGGKVANRIDSNLKSTSFLRKGDKYRMGLLKVSPSRDIIGIDMLETDSSSGNNRRVKMLQAGYGRSRDTFSNIYSENVNVVHLIQPSEEWSIFYQPNDNPADSSGGLEYYVAVEGQQLSAYPAPDFYDPQANIVPWYDTDNEERFLFLAAGLDETSPPQKRLREVTVSESDDGSYKGLRDNLVIPSGLEAFTSKAGYMGTDMLGKTLVLAGNPAAPSDELVAILSPNGQADIAALKEKMQNTSLRVQPYRVENAGGTFRSVKINNGWLLLFAGAGELGTVWITDGTVEKTEEIETGVRWAEFSGDAYQITAAGKNMAAINYVKEGNSYHKLIR